MILHLQKKQTESRFDNSLNVLKGRQDSVHRFYLGYHKS